MLVKSRKHWTLDPRAIMASFLKKHGLISKQLVLSLHGWHSDFLVIYYLFNFFFYKLSRKKSGSTLTMMFNYTAVQLRFCAVKVVNIARMQEVVTSVNIECSTRVQVKSETSKLLEKKISYT